MNLITTLAEIQETRGGEGNRITVVVTAKDRKKMEIFYAAIVRKKKKKAQYQKQDYTSTALHGTQGVELVSMKKKIIQHAGL